MFSGNEALRFEEHVRLRQDALLRTARRLVPDPVDAHDLLQTAFTQTFDRWDRIVDKNLADTYLRRVVINTRTEWWRARKFEIARYGLSEDAATETAMVCGEPYRNGAEWKFRAVGQGYASGLAGIAQDFGVSL